MQQMAARPRQKGRKDWPANLHARKRGESIYYYWRNPASGREHSLKCPGDLETAKRRAQEANEVVYSQWSPTTATRATVKDLADKMLNTVLPDRGLAHNTVKAYKSHLGRIVDHLGAKTPVSDVTTQACRVLVESLLAEGKRRAAQAARSHLVEFFNEAAREGLIKPADNPATILRGVRVKVKRARLEFDQFKAILAHWEHGEPWRRLSLLLAITTAQRAGDVASMRFAKGSDWGALWKEYAQARGEGVHSKPPYPYIDGNRLHVVQEKTGALLRIPLDLRLDCLGVSVGEVVKSCRGTGIASPYLLHRSERKKGVRLGGAIHVAYLARSFKAARDTLEDTWSPKAPPTYHEIRSLAERLYDQQGVNTQLLLGHKQASTTAIYKDPRDLWVDVV